MKHEDYTKKANYINRLESVAEDAIDYLYKAAYDTKEIDFSAWSEDVKELIKEYYELKGV